MPKVAFAGGLRHIPGEPAAATAQPGRAASGIAQLAGTIGPAP